MKRAEEPDLTPRLVEAAFPFAAISWLVEADRRGRDPVYGVHKWFARRPPTLVRALLLASQLPAGTTDTEFWRRHAEPGKWLEGSVVYDPFMGGGTSLVESARMGATVIGRDVDPLAVAVVESELRGTHSDLADKSSTLIEEVQREAGDLFSGLEDSWTPLHWFWLTEPTCPGCHVRHLMYKDLILATSTGRAGAVLRDDEMHVFCPDCRTVHAMPADRKRLKCCGKYWDIRDGNVSSGRFVCVQCGLRSSHETLQTGTAPRILIAVEETHPSMRRRIRSATSYDSSLARLADVRATGIGADYDVKLEVERRDRRPVSAGYATTRSLFTSRQWIVFVAAFDRMRKLFAHGELEQDLTLMLTGALASNNVLCSYARDWGRLAPLFSVRGFSLPLLHVELNPFHPTAGRGTLRSARARVLQKRTTGVRRARWTGSESTVTRPLIQLPVEPARVDVLCKSATDATGELTQLADICVTDPPYFDYIAYSELSEFYRAWLRQPALAGVPLLPNHVAPVESFAWGLAEALTVTLAHLAPGAPVVFTYHSSNEDAWRAIGLAFDQVKLAVVALWPVLADPHMGHHAAEGNCEWDVVVVARRSSETRAPHQNGPVADPASWLSELARSGFVLGSGDRLSFEYACAMAAKRFARVGKSSAATSGRANLRGDEISDQRSA